MIPRLAPQVEADLDEIWLYLARETGDLDFATRQIDLITDRFSILARFPQAGRRRDREFGAGVRSFPVGEYVIVYCIEGDEIWILRIVHGKRDLEGLFDV